MLLQLLMHAGKGALQAVMVGDTEYDLLMAQALQVPSIAVSYGAHRAERLQAFAPLLCTGVFSEVVECILRRL